MTIGISCGLNNFIMFLMGRISEENFVYICSGLILGLRLANERRRYKVTPSLIGWAQT